MGKLKELDASIYNDAQNQGISVTELISRQNPDCEADLPSDAFLERAKFRMLRQPIPDDLRRGKDAFELQLQEHQIRISGREADSVESFYKTDTSRILFPEFINREVQIGMMLGRNECQLEDLIAATQTIDSVTYQTIAAALASDNKGAYRVGEKGKFPTTTITYGEKSISLYKFGHAIESTYEVLRRMSIPNLAIHLRLVGKRLARTKVAEAISVLINGDGNSNAAPVFDKPLLNYDNIVDFDMEWEDYEATVWVGNKATVAGLLKLSEFKDPQAGFTYQKDGKLISPLGVTLRRESNIPANHLLGVDKNAALEEVKEQGSNLVEADKIIKTQFQEVIISEVAGFARIYKEAAMNWDYTDD